MDATRKHGTESGNERVHVDKSLSRGLADRAFAALDRQGRRYVEGVCPILRSRLEGKKSLNRVTRALQQHAERLRLIQTIGSSPNRRHVTVCQFAPCLVDDEGRPSIALTLHQFALSASGVALGPDWSRCLLASEHAIERLFQRLNTLDLAKVTSELHDAVLLALPLCDAAVELGLRQLALPTSSGAFLCNVERDGTLEAKTWLEDVSTGERWSPVVAALRTAVALAGGEAALAVVLSLGLAESRGDTSVTLHGRLRNALDPHAWMRDPYAPRHDPVGQRWRLARDAARAGSRSVAQLVASSAAG